MRRLLAVGFSLGLAASASAQFASDRKTPVPAAPAAPPSFEQVAAASSKTVESPSAHPWYVKPEHGQWMVLVKSYTGENAKGFAESLAKEIRETYKIPAYLFERGSEDKKKEEDRVRKEWEKNRDAEEKQFLAIADQLRNEAFRKGQDFQESKPAIRAPKVRYEQQYAVLVGGWKDMETARKGLDAIRTWNDPKDKRLMDRGFVGGETMAGKQSTLNGGYLNPFKLAFVAPNPVAPKTLSSEAGADPLVLQMNKEEALSVLKIQKPWTLVVKSYYAPLVDVKDKDAGNVISIRKLFSSRPDYLNKTAEIAVNLAKLLRSLQPTAAEPRMAPFESYVLHSLNGSLVCVGQFDSPEDPKIAEMRARLEALRLNVGEKGAAGNKIYPFDHLALMRVK
jgi:Formiminotransferase domain, N-terminal subdomain